MMDRVLPFDIDVVSRCLRLPKEGMSLSSVAQYKDEDLDDVFTPMPKLQLVISYPKLGGYGGCGYHILIIGFCYPSQRIIFWKKGWE